MSDLLKRMFNLIVIAAVVLGVWFYGPGKLLDHIAQGFIVATGKANEGLDHIPTDGNIMLDTLSKGGEGSFDTAQTQQQLGELAQRVSLPDNMGGYSRKTFPHWRETSDIPGWEGVGNGKCNTREATLVRDGVNVVFDDECHVTGGTWVDGYGSKQPDGSVVHASTTNPKDVDVDHVVPLGEAWRTGAQQWDEHTRIMFANDPLNLMASSAKENRRKGDKNLENYVPEASGDASSRRCEYVVRYVGVKHKYGLTVTNPELHVMRETLHQCGL